MRYLRLAGGAVTACVLGGAILVGSGFTPGGGSGSGDVPRLISAKLLPDGAEKDVYSNGATFVGTPGTRVTFLRTDHGLQAAVTPPDPGTASAEKAMADAYAAHGRSPARDARDLGTPPSAAAVAATRRLRTSSPRAGSCGVRIFASGTQSIGDGHITLKGAYRRYTVCDTDPKHHYTYDVSQISGQGRNPCWTLSCSVDTMGTEHRYRAGDIVRWAPQSDQTPVTSTCETQTVGLGFYGSGVADSVQVCPDHIHPNVPTRDFKVQWQGCTHSGATKAAEAISADRVANGVAPRFTYIVYYHWSYC